MTSERPHQNNVRFCNQNSCHFQFIIFCPVCSRAPPIVLKEYDVFGGSWREKSQIYRVVHRCRCTTSKFGETPGSRCASISMHIRGTGIENSPRQNSRTMAPVSYDTVAVVNSSQPRCTTLLRYCMCVAVARAFYLTNNIDIYPDTRELINYIRCHTLSCFARIAIFVSHFRVPSLSLLTFLHTFGAHCLSKRVDHQQCHYP
jgi:hypothetical protein